MSNSITRIATYFSGMTTRRPTSRFRLRAGVIIVPALILTLAFGLLSTAGRAAPSNTTGLPLVPHDLKEATSAEEAILEYRGWRGEVIPTDQLDTRANTGLLDEPWDSIDECIIAEMANKGIPGASIAVLSDGEIAYARGYGIKHADREDAIDEGTLFRIGSSTKMMTAAALLQQVEAGRIEMLGPVADVITGFEVAGTWDYPDVGTSDVTPWHLLTHSSGFPDNLFLSFGGIAGPTTSTALADWASSHDEVMLHAPPGSFWNYSNSNYSLAGRMVEMASGQPYHVTMVEDVWQPADMAATFLLPADAIAYNNYSWGHAVVDPTTGDPLPPVPPDGYDNWPAAPAGFAFSTPTDMVRWAKLLIDGGGDVLRQASVDAMHQPHVHLDIVPQSDYGYGIFVEEVSDLTIYNHGGNIPGWSSQFFWVPERGFALSILGNTMSSLSMSAGCALVNALQLEASPPADHSTDPATWHRFTGVYRGLDLRGNSLETHISHHGDHLMATFPDLIAPGVAYTSTMPQMALDTFYIDSDGDREPDEIVTFIDEEGAAADHPRWLRNRAFVLTRQGDLPDQDPATATATPVASATLVAATPTPGPTALPTVDISAEACPAVAARVPPAALSSALANPTGVMGYGKRCFPHQPVSPFNPLRQRLDLQNPNRPYHPTFNPLVFVCGCR